MEKVKKIFLHFFIPNEQNNYRAKSLHPDFLSLYLVIAFFLAVVFNRTGITNVLSFATDISIEKLYQLTNQEREKNNLPDLVYNNQLSQAAYQKAQDMFQKNYWSHYAPDGKTPWDFILSSGYKYEYAGENLAKNFLFSDGVVSAWMTSPVHRENLLKKEYSDVGLAVVNGILNGEQTTLVVQMFGKLISSSLAIQNQPMVPQVLAKKQLPVEKKSVNFPYHLNFVFLTFLLIILALDFYFASKFNIIRVAGKNIGHFLFIIFIITSLLIISRGVIL
ncbi:hypothetical protein COW98_00660 [Candidatus Roizmanbacteria bacterium CG22_combo_CG10-13_8_21_14_all_35_9]|uniref:SCP domain-containing protein n=4 Tax=Candidatus Roizmaniibacteriota TaxID=1752723 RepID=A0A2M8F2R5_9BACT|nr:MAG: hypothetical protein COX47_03550 [Candidatus Roizmanbacteria bacterium CG23_combo_of_CG06-09_8_20_14_all_35_49]PIP63061.1 MAG: hypothetical protein COW98_00660 [Candidatus Roizmanbacteria bacterium CG22_combo_CG10-13_8_21_14_all_35_9]PIY71469.1 MAG: hypothetical protein COY88_00100 [Candidatus Roizmanbacteria bacterium CG_4_10_14_0_8_um_filter_35_28]PJC33561.1 MAG: hypothetical protein CO048_02805 [Candidatus Roizmanbacteria bacterium CG_4_9_14_0_2_um_filter_35_15]PJC82569.1 MAG: hypoth